MQLGPRAADDYMLNVMDPGFKLASSGAIFGRSCAVPAHARS